ncbi:MAG: alpha/beta hydrolase, partial [Firmicutes bacterium]|nr:alpha/beta hydrolase [Bacillota bacterium]
MMQAENGLVAVNNDCLDYVRFGGGERTLVMIPGLSDGLRTVKGLARPLALSYRELAKDFTVYMFSRAASGKAQSTREMAADLAAACAELGLGPCCVLGVSMGG